jgi:hypothetical protein
MTEYLMSIYPSLKLLKRKALVAKSIRHFLRAWKKRFFKKKKTFLQNFEIEEKSF